MKVNLELPKFKEKDIINNQEKKKKFVNYLLAAARGMVPEKNWKPEDIIDVIMSISASDEPIEILKEKQFRNRLREEFKKTEKYNEPFSILILDAQINNNNDIDIWGGLIDSLSERLRSTDQVYIYKKKIVAILPHAGENVASNILGRVNILVEDVMGSEYKNLKKFFASFPSKKFNEKKEFLKWIDNCS